MSGQGHGPPNRPTGRRPGPGGPPRRPGAPPQKINPDAKYHVLESVGSDPLYLRPGEDFLIGRNTDCSLTIPSKRVSRQHSQIFWRSDLPVIRNMSEQNQTIVNGSAIQEQELRHRDEIQIGPYHCTYTFAKGGAIGGAGGKDLNQATLVAESGAAMRGTLESTPVDELLLDLERNKKTGTLRIRNAEGIEGMIVIEKGAFYSATLGTDRNEGALRKMVQTTSGSFEFSLEKRTAPLKLIRKFDYSASAPEDLVIEIKQVKITDYLKWVEDGCRGAPRSRGGRGGRGRGGGGGG
ncbi:MAG: FHA domain-containing protein, partial [Planctomycetes bacterium]|nr:FHA domain-containing protein [Planctomycetota bacterium]